MYTFIFVSLIVAAWMILGFLPWLAVSVMTRGRAGLGVLPLCVFGAVVAGLAVPVLGKDDVAGMWFSGLAALAVSAALVTLARLVRDLPHGSERPGAQ